MKKMQLAKILIASEERMGEGVWGVGRGWAWLQTTFADILKN